MLITHSVTVSNTDGTRRKQVEEEKKKRLRM